MTIFSFVLPSLVAIYSFSLCFATPSDLDAVVVVFRHGDRTPIRPYPNDPYKDRSLWPADWGMLTNKGKQQQFELGQFFRQRYADFLPQVYSRKDIYVRSTDVDRTLMSAEANLAGLYPPINTDVWNGNLTWQPIPIHTIPEKMDPVLGMKKPCKKYDYLKENLFKSAYFRNISHANHDLYSYLSRWSGDTITDLQHLQYLYSTLQIETWYNFTLPDWTKPVFPRKMQASAFITFATHTFTTDLARLKVGPFFNELMQYFHNRTATNKTSQYYAPKFLMFSGHDTTIANLLNSMGAFDYHAPPYTATIIFELHKASDRAYVNLFYKNSTEVRPFKVRSCEFDCELKHFEKILKPITLDVNVWEEECNSLFLFNNSTNLYLLVSALFLGLAAIGILLVIARNRVRRKDINEYSQLPNEEYA